MSRQSNLQARAAVEVVLAVAQCIHDLRAVPSGHLYARLMGHLSIDDYQRIVATLVHAGLVRQHPNHLLEWVGPQWAALGSQETTTRKETMP